MANQEQLEILKQGVRVWNRWRQEHPDIHPDLREADFRNADLRDAVLHSTDLHSANFRNANLRDAKLMATDLRYADLCKANLAHADLTVANIRNADLRGANLSFRSCLQYTTISAAASPTTRELVNDDLRLCVRTIQRKAKFDRCTILQRLRLSPGFALAEFSFF